MGLPVEIDLEERFLESLAATGSKIAACASINRSRAFYAYRSKNDPVFTERMEAAMAKFPAAVLSVVADGLLHGFKHQVMDREGCITTLRRYDSTTTLAYLKRHCGWDEPVADTSMDGKEVSYKDHNGQDVDPLELIRKGIEEQRGITIKPSRVVDIEVGGPYPEPE